MKERIAICVYSFDLTPAGELGAGTMRRLKLAVKRQRATGGILVVAATYSPYHKKNLHVTMASLMTDWIWRHGVPETEVIKLQAETFNTEGEASAFAMLQGFACKEHVSSWWHLLRIWRLLLRYEHRATVKLRPVWEWPALKAFSLELVKHMAMFLSPSQQEWCKTAAMRVVGRTSY